MPQPETQSAVVAYVSECARITRTGRGTDERSYYPALNSLLSRVGRMARPVRTTIPEPASREGDFPDLAVYEDASQVLVLPLEAKPLDTDLDALARQSQPTSYARTFGGGHVLLTNLHEFAWAELDQSNRLAIRDRVALTARAQEFTNARPQVLANAGQRLAEMLDAACAVRATITEADDVARLLAYHATRMLAAVSIDPHTLLQPLADSMRDGLGMELEEDFFAPTVVQTLVYATFAAWVETDDPATWNWRNTGFELRIPVIAELFHRITDPEFVRRCDLVRHLDATARVLRWVDRTRFVASFDAAAIEYFYEPFLARFDPDLRDKLGVWYTPREIAEYQVRRADHHVRHDLGIRDGLADDAVIVLDPAVGTGTYLRAVLDRIYQHHIDNGEPATLAAERTRTAALTRVIGFDVLPAAFVVAHLHLTRYLTRLGQALGPNDRVRVYLTNSLMGWGTGSGLPPLPLPGLEAELRASLSVKHNSPVLVVLGNPPYAGFSAADMAEERALLDDWIAPLWSEYGLRKHRLGDLYVRFWRIAVRKIQDLTGKGIVTYITNRKWLGGRSFPAMRDHMVHAFQKIVIDDLHGDVHDTAHPGDGSVFTTETALGIQRGVAVTTMIRTGPTMPGQIAVVLARDLRGSGQAKRMQLAALRDALIDEGLDRRAVSAATRWKLTTSASGDDPTLDEYFDFFVSGVQPVREEAVMDTDATRLEGRMREYFDSSISVEKLIQRHPAFGVLRRRYDADRTRQRLLREAVAFDALRVVPFLFHPLDVRWLYWETRHKLLNEARRELVPFYLDFQARARVSDQFAIVASQTPRRPEAARPALTSAVPGFHVVDPDARVLPRLAPTVARDDGGRGLPLYANQQGPPRTNIKAEWLAAARTAGIDGGDVDVGDTLFYSLIAVMYATSWVASVGTDLDDFAPVPLPADRDGLMFAASVGRRVAALADPCTSVVGVTEGRLDPRYAPLAVPDRVGGVELTTGNRNAGGRWITEPGGGGAVLWDGANGWRNVPRRCWEFSVGGFAVLSKWLGYRHHSRAVSLNSDDIRLFTHLVRRIAAILDEEPDCERVYQTALARPLEPPAVNATPSV